MILNLQIITNNETFTLIVSGKSMSLYDLN